MLTGKKQERCLHYVQAALLLDEDYFPQEERTKRMKPSTTGCLWQARCKGGAHLPCNLFPGHACTRTCT
eukprot:977472-Pelagomonas_calceolata.AAC.2